MTTTKAKVEEKKPSAEDQKEEKPKYREKPQLPSVSHLLTHGAEKDPNAEPETFLESLMLPALLLITFLMSLMVFHWATDGLPRYVSNSDFKQKYASGPGGDL